MKKYCDLCERHVRDCGIIWKREVLIGGSNIHMRLCRDCRDKVRMNGNKLDVIDKDQDFRRKFKYVE